MNMQNFINEKGFAFDSCGVLMSTCSTVIQKVQLKENSKSFSEA